MFPDILEVIVNFNTENDEIVYLNDEFITQVNLGESHEVDVDFVTNIIKIVEF